MGLRGSVCMQQNHDGFYIATKSVVNANLSLGPTLAMAMVILLHVFEVVAKLCREISASLKPILNQQYRSRLDSLCGPTRESCPSQTAHRPRETLEAGPKSLAQCRGTSGS